ncbi:MAG: GNAT family N-acetyltransferase [Clostridia bacterium]|nr:GNAT family N-acetyltransferase [Clostridia bacterium]
MGQVEIRWADENDWHDLGVIHSGAYRSAYKNIIPDYYLQNYTVEKRQEYYRNALRAGTEKIAIMFVDGKAAGLITVGKCRDEDLDNTYGEILGIYLLEDFWGMGFGKRLIHWGSDRIKESGYSRVALWVLKENVNARRFYESLGFICDGKERLITRGKQLVQVRYKKHLSNNFDSIVCCLWVR